MNVLDFDITSERRPLVAEKEITEAQLLLDCDLL